MAESVADNILLQIVEETTKHNDNITKQMSADRTLLGKLIEHNEMLPLTTYFESLLHQDLIAYSGDA